jgi:hypothetical protein
MVDYNISDYIHGGLERDPVNILRLISELEGSYQLLKFMAYDEDMKVLEEMKTRYYKVYFKLLKQQKNENSNT